MLLQLLKGLERRKKQDSMTPFSIFILESL